MRQTCHVAEEVGLEELVNPLKIANCVQSVISSNGSRFWGSAMAQASRIPGRLRNSASSESRVLEKSLPRKNVGLAPCEELVVLDELGAASPFSPTHSSDRLCSRCSCWSALTPGVG